MRRGEGGTLPRGCVLLGSNKYCIANSVGEGMVLFYEIVRIFAWMSRIFVIACCGALTRRRFAFFDFPKI